MSCGTPPKGVIGRVGRPSHGHQKAICLANEFGNDRVFRGRRAACVLGLLFLFAGSLPAGAAGIRAGTLIENTASVDFQMDGEPGTVVSNTVSFQVAERLDVTVTLQSPPVTVLPGDVDRALLFRVTNTGNGDEVFTLAMNSVVAGDDFDPDPAQPDAIFFDTDGSGDFGVADVPYVPGTNDPLLAPDASVDLLLLNDIPGNATNAQRGRSELAATAATGSGAPGTVLGGQGDGGIDAVVGATGATATVFGEYVVDDTTVSVQKAQAILDPAGGSEPVVGAIITYTITVEVIGSGTAAAAVISDPVPTWSTYVPGSITLNGTPVSDASDADAGEFDNAVVPAVVVRLGDLTQADGVQTIVFRVQID